MTGGRHSLRSRGRLRRVRQLDKVRCMRSRSFGPGLLLILLSVGSGPARALEPAPQRAETSPPARFTDSQRRAKLATAFPEIDKLIAAFMARTHVPGAAWGIIVDGELAHLGVSGYRERPS